MATETHSAPTRTTTFTAADVRAKLAERESDEPDTVLEILKEHDGKPLTKRLLAKLPGGADRWLIRQIANMTSLEDRAYLHSQGNRGIHLLVAYQTTSVRIDAAWVEEHNAGYFKGRRERNALRETSGKNLPLCLDMAKALTAFAQAKSLLDEAKRQLEVLTEHGAAFSPDQYDWQRLCGAYEERSR
jgi:hypothetical protein